MECELCRKCFFSRCNLKRHLKTIHKDIKRLPRLSKPDLKYKCILCNRNFSKKYHLTYHQKHIHNITDNVGNRRASYSKQKKCPMCNFRTNMISNILEHFKSEHDIAIDCQELNFSSEGDFKKWLSNIEKSTKSKYVKKQRFVSKTHETFKLYCHRSGYYTSESKGKRHLKTQGSNKINAFCPSSVTVIIKSNGSYFVKYCPNHIGHQTDIGHLYLTSEEKKCIATKIASKVPFSAILDEVRDSMINTELERVHLLTRKDLFNIETSFRLRSSSLCHKNDAVSIESWAQEMLVSGGTVLFYKPQEKENRECPFLKVEDFVLIIMTDAQREILQKFGSDCICIDRTHSLNEYGFELHTILILDDLRHGFPCAFLISNRSDQDVLALFFSCIKEKTGLIGPKVFMSDTTETYFNAWLQEMNPPKSRLYCTWHLDRAWQSNLFKILTKEKQVIVYKQLHIILKETDLLIFSTMMKMFLEELNSDVETQAFFKYFKKYYAGKSHLWAYCRRMHLGLDTNIHIERMHKTLKYLYLNGKHSKQLDKAIGAIMRMVRDKLYDQLVVKHKGKICSKIKEMRLRHQKSLDLDLSLVIPTNKGWEIPSSSNQFGVYYIEENENNCNCQLLCSDCGTCIHKFRCSCLDSSIKWNMCKHIHLLVRYMINKEKVQTTKKPLAEHEDTDENILFIKGAQDLPHHKKLNEIKTGNVEISLGMKRENVRQKIMNLLDNAQTCEELCVIEKSIQPVEASVITMSSERTKILELYRSKQQCLRKNNKLIN